MTRRLIVATRGGVGACLVLLPVQAQAQHAAPDVHTADSVTVEAGAHYQAGGLHRFLFGGSYRDLWTTPIRVPVLDLRAFDGGMTVDKAGGGTQTKSLTFTGRDGAEYTFRSVDKDHVQVPAGFRDVPIAEGLAHDQISDSHPAANVMVPPLLEAVGVLHDSPVLVVMPDDTLLGRFRAVFANRLGVLELHPRGPKGDRAGFDGAIAIINSDSLLQLLDHDPAEQVDARTFLAARLVDMLVNNWDRHPGQWKWARMPASGSRWEPISQDYDKAFISVTGFLPGLTRMSTPNLITFGRNYPSIRGLTWNSLQLDRRLLGELGKAAFDSVARSVQGRLTDSVLDAVMLAMPAEYRALSPDLIATLRARRRTLPAMAQRFYRYLAAVVDIHATDAAARATIIRVDDSHVEVRLATGDAAPFYIRRFDARETTGIRVYLSGGNDHALVTGDVTGSIPVWVIGGNGTNRLVDSSTVDGHRSPTHFHDVGATRDVSYGADTLFDRRPFVHEFGGLDQPGRDYGASMAPVVGLSINHDLGVMPAVGMTWHGYGFRDTPYTTMVSLLGQYSFRIGGFRVALAADRRMESSPWHFSGLVRMSQLELTNFHGFGNSSPQSAEQVVGITGPANRLFRRQPAPVARGTGAGTLSRANDESVLRPGVRIRGHGQHAGPVRVGGPALRRGQFRRGRGAGGLRPRQSLAVAPPATRHDAAAQRKLFPAGMGCPARIRITPCQGWGRFHDPDAVAPLSGSPGRRREGVRDLPLSGIGIHRRPGRRADPRPRSVRRGRIPVGQRRTAPAGGDVHGGVAVECRLAGQ